MALLHFAFQLYNGVYKPTSKTTQMDCLNIHIYSIHEAQYNISYLIMLSSRICLEAVATYSVCSWKGWICSFSVEYEANSEIGQKRTDFVHWSLFLTCLDTKSTSCCAYSTTFFHFICICSMTMTHISNNKNYSKQLKLHAQYTVGIHTQNTVAYLLHHNLFSQRWMKRVESWIWRHFLCCNISINFVWGVVIRSN